MSYAPPIPPAPPPEAVDSVPECFDWLEEARQRYETGRPEAALLAAERAAEKGEIPALMLLAAIHFSLGHLLAAQEACNLVLRQVPDHPEALFNTAMILQRMGDLPAAEHAYRRTLALCPDATATLSGLAQVYGASQRHQEAIALLRQVTVLRPQDAQAHFDLADMLLAEGNLEGASQTFQDCLALDPMHHNARIGLALALSAQGEVAAAEVHLAQVAAAAPEALQAYRSPFIADQESQYPSLAPRRIYLAIAYSRLCQGDWSHRKESQERLTRWLATETPPPLDDPDLPFAALAFDLSSAEQHKLGQQVAARIQATVPPLPPPRHQAGARRRLRIGYVSSDLRRHATGFLTRSLFALHDRKEVEIYAYSTRAGDDSDVEQDIATSCDVFRRIHHLPDAAATALIAQDRIDILVDLAGYTKHARSRIFAARPAPIQVGYLGYPCTTGASWLDYAILDETVAPATELSHWSEAPVYLPDTYFIYNDHQPVHADPCCRADAGLPEDARVLCCFNGTWKIEPGIFSVWMEILRRSPASVLWLYADNKETPGNLWREAERQGINPHRLIFAPPLPHEQHLARYRLADLCLDTPLCNGHTTTADALYMACPVLTRPGCTMASRVASSLLRAAGLEELIATSDRDYLERALALLENPDTLRALHRRMEQHTRQTPLFATEQRVRQLEQAYRLMWEQRQQRGPHQPPRPIRVP